MQDKHNNDEPKVHLDYVRIPLKMMQSGLFKVEACLVYSYMLNRYRYFVELAKTKNRLPEYHESISSIAKQVSVSESTVKRALKLLKQQEYIEYKLIRKGTSFNNTYTVYDKYNIYRDKQVKTPIQTASTKQIETDDRPLWMRDDFDDTNLPF